MFRTFRLLSVLSLLVLVAVVAGACQPVQAASAPVPRSLADIAEQYIGIRQSAVVDGVGPSQAADPAQAQLENEFRNVVLDRERAYYAQDAERFFSYYADNMVLLPPGGSDVVGKAAVMAGDQPFFDGTDIVGQFTLKGIWVSGDYATRWGEWQEVTRPKAGGPAEHHIGRCQVGYQKIDGEWKVVSTVFNMIQDSKPVE